YHISFGIAVVSGVFIYLVITFLYAVCRDKQKREVIGYYFKTFLLMIVGIGLSGLPFFAFEVRHGFMQLTTIINTLTTPHSVVGVTGISYGQILTYFAQRFAALVSLPMSYAIILGVIVLSIASFHLIKSKQVLTFHQIRLFCVTLIV